MDSCELEAQFSGSNKVKDSGGSGDHNSLLFREHTNSKMLGLQYVCVNMPKSYMPKLYSWLASRPIKHRPIIECRRMDSHNATYKLSRDTNSLD